MDEFEWTRAMMLTLRMMIMTRGTISSAEAGGGGDGGQGMLQWTFRISSHLASLLAKSSSKVGNLIAIKRCEDQWQSLCHSAFWPMWLTFVDGCHQIDVSRRLQKSRPSGKTKLPHPRWVILSWKVSRTSQCDAMQEPVVLKCVGNEYGWLWECPCRRVERLSCFCLWCFYFALYLRTVVGTHAYWCVSVLTKHGN